MRGVSHSTCVLAHSHALMIVTSITGSSQESGLAACASTSKVLLSYTFAFVPALQRSRRC